MVLAMPKLLIDADKFIYSAGFAIETSKYYALNEHGTKFLIPRKTKRAAKKYCKERKMKGKIYIEKEVSPLSHGMHALKLMVNKIFKVYPGYDYTLYITNPDIKKNFKYKIAKTIGYKSGRKDTGRPHYYDELRSYMIKTFNTESVTGIEADDAVIINYAPGDIICSVDKDLHQFPARFFNYDKKLEFEITPGEAIYNFYFQILHGDVSDSIPGLKYWLTPRTCGEKGVKKLFKECFTEDQYYAKIKEHYILNLLEDYDFSMFKERFTEMAQLLYLKRTIDDIWMWKYDTN